LAKAQSQPTNVLMVAPGGSDFAYVPLDQVQEYLNKGAEPGIRMTSPDGKQKAIVPYSQQDAYQKKGATWDDVADNHTFSASFKNDRTGKPQFIGTPQAESIAAEYEAGPFIEPGAAEKAMGYGKSNKEQATDALKQTGMAALETGAGVVGAPLMAAAAPAIGAAAASPLVKKLLMRAAGGAGFGAGYEVMKHFLPNLIGDVTQIGQDGRMRPMMGSGGLMAGSQEEEV
jgi:hypothetical protein